jgi:hypothetical protein
MSFTALLTPFAAPLASLLAIPMLSSWSTSLNLVFLSLAWTTIAATYSPLQLEAFAPLFIRLTLYIFPSLVFLLFDIGIPSLSVEFKSQGKHGIATRQKGGKRKMWRVVGWSVANVCLTVAVQAAVEWVVTDVLRMRSLLQIKGSKWGLNHLPYPWTMIKHAVMGLLARNVSLSLSELWWVKGLTQIRRYSITFTRTCCTRRLVVCWPVCIRAGTTASRCHTPLWPTTTTQCATSCIDSCHCICQP